MAECDELLLCVRQCLKLMWYINSFNLQTNPMRVVLLCLCNRWRNTYKKVVISQSHISPMWQDQDSDLDSLILCPSSWLSWGQQKETTGISLWWLLSSEEKSVKDHQKKSAHLWLKRVLGFHSANNHKTSMWNGLIIAIFYHLGHGSISFCGRENLMSSLQYAHMFPALQFSTKAGSQEQSTISKSIIALSDKEKIPRNYILLDKYLNGRIFAIYMNLYILCF